MVRIVEICHGKVESAALAKRVDDCTDHHAVAQVSPPVVARQIIDGSLLNFNKFGVHFSANSSVLNWFCKQRVYPVSMHLSRLDLRCLNLVPLWDKSFPT